MVNFGSLARMTRVPELRAREARLASREDSIEGRLVDVGTRERAVTAREAALSEARSSLEARSAELEGCEPLAQSVKLSGGFSDGSSAKEVFVLQAG